MGNYIRARPKMKGDDFYWNPPDLNLLKRRVLCLLVTFFCYAILISGTEYFFYSFDILDCF